MSNPSTSPSSRPSNIIVPIIDPHSVPSVPSAHITPITIDALGGLTLLVGTELPDETPAAIKVCPVTLHRASRVFGAMLFGGWRESRPATGTWTVELPVDQPRAIAILCGIAHAKFGVVPPEIVQNADFGIVSDVVVVAEKYQMMKVLTPFTDAWLGTLWGIMARWGGMDVLQRANVAWQFWGTAELAFVVKTAVWEMGREGVEELKEVARRATDLGMASNLTDILRPIPKLRLQAIQEILDFFHGGIVAPRSPPSTRPAVPNLERGCRRAAPGSRQARKCDRWTIEAVANFADLEFVKRRQASEIEGSAEQLITGLKALFHGLRSNYFRGHKMCCPLKEVEEFEGILERKWERMHNVIESHHFDEMHNRRADMEYYAPFPSGSYRFKDNC